MRVKRHIWLVLPLAGLPLAAVATSHDPVATLALGASLYQQHCASCHGVTLEGQSGWRSPDADGRYPAPPHDAQGHTWHHSDTALMEYVALGGQAVLDRMGVAFNSGMPAFGSTLSDDERGAILAFIKSTWPERQRGYQADRTAADAD